MSPAKRPPRAWYERRQPTLIAEAARRAGFRSTPYVGRVFVVVDEASGTNVLEARFTAAGQLVSAVARDSTGVQQNHQIGFAPDGRSYRTARAIVDELVAWLADGRPAPGAAAHPSLAPTTTPAEHVADVLPFRPRRPRA